MILLIVLSANLAHSMFKMFLLPIWQQYNTNMNGPLMCALHFYGTYDSPETSVYSKMRMGAKGNTLMILIVLYNIFNFSIGLCAMHFRTH